MEDNHRTSQSGEPDEESERFIHQKTVRKQSLINRLNYVNFQDDTVLVTFRHSEYHHKVSLKAKPEPCVGEDLACTWLMTEKSKLPRLTSYRFEDIKILNGRLMTVIKPVDIHISEKGIHALLPETGMEVSSRKTKRYACKEISAQLIQQGVSFSGKLIDFSSVSFHLELSEATDSSLSWINPSAKVTLILSSDGDMLYAGECDIFKFDPNTHKRSYVLMPSNEHIRRFKPKDFRAVRQRLTPAPYLSFIHPFTKKITKLQVVDLSGNGFSVREDFENAVLIPGMIIPELSLYVATSFKASCKAQVIYRSVYEEKEGDISVQCGIAILDMEFEQHCDLLAWLYQAKDEKSFLGTCVDLDDLWRFLFESGFIYPHKYAFLEKNKGDIKATYKKLYSEPGKIARHFIYQDNGRILGHMAMIRFYEKSWIIHHHAADRYASGNAGFDVLEQISRFINESHSIPSFNMNYVFCYFRPENKFPDRIFGGVARNTNDPKKCSLDKFLYFHHKKRESQTEHFEEPWRLIKALPGDLTELKIFYENLSGGLMLEAFELRPESEGVGSIVDEYRNLGFIREKHLFSLKKNNDLKAVILVNMADIGLNLSDITNSIHVFITDGDDLTEQVLEEALSILSQNFEQTDIPVLVFPNTYASFHDIKFEKTYCLWVMHLQHIDDYYRHLNRFFSKVSSLKAFQKKIDHQR